MEEGREEKKQKQLREREVGERENGAMKEKGSDTSSGTDNFYFGLVVNSAVCVCVQEEG